MLMTKAHFIYIMYHVKFEFLAYVALKVFKTSGSTFLGQLIFEAPSKNCISYAKEATIVNKHTGRLKVSRSLVSATVIRKLFRMRKLCVPCTTAGEVY